MNNAASERRLVENEVVFRELNRRLQVGIDAVNKVALEEGEQPVYVDGDEAFYFYCECSDENCKQRLRISLNEYNKIHQDSKSFIVARNHEVMSLEDVIFVGTDYSVVRKHLEPPRKPVGLHTTTVDNVS